MIDPKLQDDEDGDGDVDEDEKDIDSQVGDKMRTVALDEPRLEFWFAARHA